MKNVVIALFFLGSIQMLAQNEIKTTVLKGDQLITYAAENFPASEHQQVYILIETGNMGINLESKFYIEKGIDLLLKRLKQEDQIAIGVYGSANETLLSYTSIRDKELIIQSVTSLFKGTFNSDNTDGIDIAYNLAKNTKTDEGFSTMIMLRGTGEITSEIANVEMKSTSRSNDNTNNLSDIPQPQTKANHSKIGGAIALTALTILPDLIEIIKD